MSADPFKDRFLAELRHHLQGWLAKVTGDLSEEAFKSELQALQSDPVYSSFGFATPEYVLIRLMGRLSISIGRRLGEIYDKLPRFLAQARFGLDDDDVAPKVGGKLELDIGIPLSPLTSKDRDHVAAVAQKHLSTTDLENGLAIEIRYNFNPNDSARLRKDVDMATLLRESGFHGVYLIFSTISPRDEAIARLKRAGWIFLVGDAATDFMRDLIGLDMASFLNNPAIREEIHQQMGTIMGAVYNSYAVKTTLALYS